MTYADVVEAILEGIAEDMIKDQQAKKMRASGKSAESFRIDVTPEGNGKLYGAGHWYWQIHGRRPGAFKNGIETMLDWIKRKGIRPRDEKTSLRSLAFLFARKIQQQGNDIFLGKRPGIAFDKIVDKWQKIGKERISELVKENIKKEIYGSEFNK